MTASGSASNASESRPLRPVTAPAQSAQPASTWAAKASDRAAITLSGVALQRARKLAEAQGDVTPGEIVRRALSVYEWIYDELGNGSQFKLQPAHGDAQVLKFLYT